MKYIYFIAYFMKTKNGFGFGNVNITRNKKINNIEEIRDIEEIIKDDCKLETVSIMNYKLLSW